MDALKKKNYHGAKHNQGAVLSPSQRHDQIYSTCILTELLSPAWCTIQCICKPEEALSICKQAHVLLRVPDTVEARHILKYKFTK